MGKNKIILTGGGSTGHVSVNLALIPLLKKHGYEIHYIGSKKGIEKELITKIPDVRYHEISTGKLRRFISFENFIDFFRVILGIFQSIWKIFKIKPQVVFSKGGYVSVPVIIGAWINGVPSLAHESDLTPGLANKLVQPFIKNIFTTFPETNKYIKSNKGIYLGPVIREDLLNGDKDKIQKELNLNPNKKTMLVMGGSLGAKFINKFIHKNLDKLLQEFNIIHATGKNGLDKNINKKNYYQFEYINSGLNNILAASDIVISRSGSNAIFEFLYYKIPMLLIPLPTTQSRGDQIDNAKSFKKQGFAEIIYEEDYTNDKMFETIQDICININHYKENMEKINFQNTTQKIFEKIEEIKK